LWQHYYTYIILADTTNQYLMLIINTFREESYTSHKYVMSCVKQRIEPKYCKQ